MPFIRVGGKVINTAAVQHIEEAPSSAAERKRNSPDLIVTMLDGTRVRGFGRISEWENLDLPIVPVSLGSGVHAVLTAWPPSEAEDEWHFKALPVIAWRIGHDGICEPLVADDGGEPFRALLLPDGTVDVAFDRTYDDEEKWRADIREQHAARLVAKDA